MGRFLIFFSYVGTRYSGVQQQLGVLKHGKPLKTAGGVLEEALAALKPVCSPRIQVSSRTDKGVHALRNSCHVDLQHPESEKEFDPAIITNVTNYNLQKMGEDLRIVETRRVSNDFQARVNATGRKYIYRLAHVLNPGHNMRLSEQDNEKQDTDIYTELKKFTKRRKHPKLPVGSPVPILDGDKLFVCRNKLDMSKLLEAAALLSGIHDFTAFSNKSKAREEHRPPPHPAKLLTIGVKRGQPFGHRILKCGQDITVTENLEFWDIHVQSKSFLYKMVRRCVGGMILVATDVISLADLHDVLDNPRRDFDFTSRLSVPGDGLFLADVMYEPEDLMHNETYNLEEKKSGLGSNEAASHSPVLTPSDTGELHSDPKEQSNGSSLVLEENSLDVCTNEEHVDR